MEAITTVLDILQSLKYIFFNLIIFSSFYLVSPNSYEIFPIYSSIHSFLHVPICLPACLAAYLTWHLLFIVLSDADDADDADDDDEADEGDSSTFSTYLMAILVISGVVAFAVVGAAMVIVLRKRRQRAALSMSRGTAESSTGSV